MITITGGSPKQDAWATEIARGWLRLIDVEIDNSRLRIADDVRDGNPVDMLERYAAILVANRDAAVEKLEAMTSRQVIDMRTNNMAAYVIGAARKKLQEV